MGNGTRLKILVADDSALYRELVKQSLSEEGDCDVFLVTDGRRAIEFFGEQRPEIVITDWTMPDISGVELCKKIRTDFPEVYAHLILLTSHAHKEQVIEGLNSGADDYLTKPFHPGELLARVRVGRRMIAMHREIKAKNHQMEELALTDALTGLPNRRAIDLWASQQLNAAARYNFPLWVALADLDHFKTVNDTHGHHVGDTVLKGFAAIMKQNTRGSNLCGRFGGEEFLLILTHCQKEGVTTALDRIRRQLEQATFTAASSSVHGCTASFGVAGFWGMVTPSVAELVGRADSALYSAKRNGRNRIEFASD